MSVWDFEAKIAKDMSVPKAREEKPPKTPEEEEREAMSKKISWLLRRGAASVGLTLADGGWAKLSELMACSTFNEFADRSPAKFMAIIQESNQAKFRYEMKESDEGTLIRAYTKEERQELEERGDSPSKAT